MSFVLLLLVSNFLLFLPRYLVALPKKWNPLDFIGKEKSVKDIIKHSYFSRTIDPFRISLEYSVACLVLLTLGFNGISVVTVLTILAVIVFVFNCYTAVFDGLINRTPILKSDLRFIKDSNAFYQGYRWLVVFVFLAFLALVGYIFLTVSQLLVGLPLNGALNALLLLLILSNGIYNLRFFPLPEYLHRTVFSVGIYCYKSSRVGMKYQSYLAIPISEITELNHYTNMHWKVRPNIHIISMESYGSVIFKDQPRYAKALASMEFWEEQFRDSEVKVHSTFIEPPLFATGTWYSYSTLLFGMLIDDGNQHDTLFSQMPNFKAYESLFRFTAREGYTNVLLHGLLGNFERTLDFRKMRNNLSYSQLIANDDLGYRGKLLKYMKMQQMLPDQFTINKGLDLVQQLSEPYTLFYGTLNSHWDYCAPLQIEKDWKKLNDPNFSFQTTDDLHQSQTERAAQAVDYGINSVFDCVQNRLREGDIYILYGDHQPTFITDKVHGKETPIHIFSKDEVFLKQWEKYGFSEGLIPNGKQPLKMEAFYSAFMKVMNQTYGENPSQDLPFFKEGVKL